MYIYKFASNKNRKVSENKKLKEEKNLKIGFKNWKYFVILLKFSNKILQNN